MFLGSLRFTAVTSKSLILERVIPPSAVKETVHSNYFGKENYPTTVILNFRLTKEIGKMLELSFMANNFLKKEKLLKGKPVRDILH